MKQSERIQRKITDIVSMLDCGKFSLAEQEIDGLRKTMPAQPDLLHLKGLCRLHAGEPMVAVELIEQAISVFPKLPDFHCNIGRSFEALGDVAAAENSYREALRLTPNFVNALVRLGELLLKQKRFSDYTQVISPEQTQSLRSYHLSFQLGFAYACLDQHELAVRQFTQAVALQPKFPEAYNNLGNALKQLRRFDEASLAYQKALKQSPDYQDALHNYSILLSSQGDHRAAYAVLCTLTQKFPQFSSGWSNLAEAALVCGELKPAAELAHASLNRQNICHIGPLLALTNLARSQHDYDGVVTLMEHHGNKIQQASVEDHYIYLIMLDWIISSWLTNQRDGLDARVKPLVEASSRFEQLRVAGVFFRLLLRLDILVDKPLWHHTDDAVLTCVGDSHSLGLDGMELSLNGRRGYVRSFFVMGAKAFHLCNVGENKFKKSLELALDLAPRHLPVLLCFGEIDCRLWEGIIPAWRSGKITNLDEAVKQQGVDYVARLVALAKSKDLTVWFHGVPAPNLDWSTINDGDRRLLIDVIQQFNAAVAAACRLHGVRFLDVYAVTAAIDGISNKKWHIDQHHLQPDYLRQLCSGSVNSNAGMAENGLWQDRQDFAGSTFSKLQVETLLDSASAAKWLALGLAFYQTKRLYEAKVAYQRAVELAPDQADAPNNLGVLLMAQGETQEALTQFERACSLCPDSAEMQTNRARVLIKLQRYQEAEDILCNVIVDNPAYMPAYLVLGYVLIALNRSEDAADCFSKVVAHDPQNFEAHIKLAELSMKLKRLEIATEAYGRAAQLCPDIAEIHYNRGHALRDLGLPEQAVESYCAALRINPGFIEAGLSVCRALLAAGRPQEAFFAAVKALRRCDHEKSRSLMAVCLRALPLDSMDADGISLVKTVLSRVIAEGWCRPGYLVGMVASIFMRSEPYQAWLKKRKLKSSENEDNRLNELELEAIFSDSLLKIALRSAPIPGIQFEQFLTEVRSAFLEQDIGVTGREISENGLDFCCALAQQIFIKEYLLPVTVFEATRVRELGQSVSALLAAGSSIRPLSLAVLAAYLPLSKLTEATFMITRKWPTPVRQLLAQQVVEPLEENAYSSTVQQLTPVDDETSVRVRRQYEENPYPRWIYPEPARKTLDVNAWFRSAFPLASFRPLGKKGGVDILIAGCGSGQQSIETARNYPDSRILAIDLSLASLGYAMRKTKELHLTNIQYAQADILRLGGLDRAFDIIESSGVLHHLASPEQGWKVLVSMLRPGGFMNIGLYSELARKSVVAARAFIAQGGYEQTLDGIRSCRQAMIEFDGDADWRPVLQWTDFYSASACRDLLFHVQEHRFTIPRIKKFLTENGLAFIGFCVTDLQVRARYRARFPDDSAAVNLNYWDVFENENPETFASMYQFWVQKTDAITK